MSSIYNTNQRMFGNQNPYQPNNKYQGPTYIPPSGGAGNYYNNMNYNQGNSYNQNNNVPQAFISGKIGRLAISSEDLETFSKSLKSAEWTNNANYAQAKNVLIKIKNMQGEKEDIEKPKNRFNDYNTYSNFNFNEFQNFIKNAEDENRRQKDAVVKEKNEFLRINFPSEKPDISNDDIYKKIGENRKSVVEKDANLFRKIERLLNLQPSAPAPSQGIYDYGKSNSMEIGNMGAPGLGF